MVPVQHACLCISLWSDLQGFRQIGPASCKQFVTQADYDSRGCSSVTVAEARSTPELDRVEELYYDKHDLPIGNKLSNYESRGVLYLL